jgi:SAM-dependent methyltransferase
MTSNDNYEISKDGIYFAKDFESIKYNDGDEHEKYIDYVFSDAANLHSDSDDLKKYIKDWPSRYHLSKERINLIKPFEGLIRDKKVLEIGSGFGAITRRLGEISHEVISLEGSVRRATIQKKRLAELSNVKIFVDNFKNFEIESKFDIILSIGVLEYSNMFYHEKNASQNFLNKTINHLNENGIFMLAIENRLGLKYLSGGNEDHTDKPMVGIENLYEPYGPITYGKKELENLLRDSGFTHINFYYPFPDYKLPNLILGEKSITNKSFDIRALIQRSQLNDYLIPETLTFDRYNSLEAIINNGIMDIFSNSFFVLASKNKIEFDNSKHVHIFSTNRNFKYQKHLSMDLSELNTHDEMKIINHTNGTVLTEKYFSGNNLLAELLKIVKKDGWTIESLITYWKKYINFLESEFLLKINLTENEELDSDFAEFVPSNLILNKESKISYIDRENISTKPITLGYLLFRAQLYSYVSVVSWRNCSDSSIKDLYTLIKRIQIEIFEGSNPDFQEYCELENARQLIIGNQVDTLKFIKTKKLNSIFYLDVIKFKNQHIEDLEQIIHGMKNSLSWRSTKILRISKIFFIKIRFKLGYSK